MPSFVCFFTLHLFHMFPVVLPLKPTLLFSPSRSVNTFFNVSPLGGSSIMWASNLVSSYAFMFSCNKWVITTSLKMEMTHIFGVLTLLFFQLGTWPTWWLRPHVRVCFYKMQIFQASAQQNNHCTAHWWYLQIIMYTSNCKFKRFIVRAHAHSNNTMAVQWNSCFAALSYTHTQIWRLSNAVRYKLRQEEVPWPPKDTLGNQRI